MKAFVAEKYGPPEMLRMAEVEKPAPVADEALVQVLAVSVNPADWRLMRESDPSDLRKLTAAAGVDSSSGTTSVN
jgi:NADPH:quinone reductase-like Zn-dependent oxidoreductase